MSRTSNRISTEQICESNKLKILKYMFLKKKFMDRACTYEFSGPVFVIRNDRDMKN